MLYDESLFNETLITMNTKKLLYSLLACLVLFIAACTNDSASDSEYDQAIDRMDVETTNKNGIDRMDVETTNRQSIDRMDVETTNREN